MRKTRETARRDGQNATARAGARKYRPNDAEARRFRDEVDWFVHDWGEGGHCPIDVRWAYADLLRKGRGREKAYAPLLRKARRAYDYAIRHALVPIGHRELRPGLRTECGWIRMPEGVAVDMEVYDGDDRLLATVSGRATVDDGLAPEDADAINRYLRLSGARLA